MEFKLDYKNKTIYINQNKYLRGLLKKFNKEKLNPVSILIELGVHLYKNEE